MEYHKALYREGQLQIVADEGAEAVAREEGFKDWAEDQPAEAPEQATDEAAPTTRKRRKAE